MRTLRRAAGGFHSEFGCQNRRKLATLVIVRARPQELTNCYLGFAALETCAGFFCALFAGSAIDRAALFRRPAATGRLVSRSDKPTKKTDVQALLGRLASEEELFLKQQFLAPALPGGQVQVRIGGVVCKVRVQPSDFQGWGIFQPDSHSAARLLRAASMSERRHYLELFPQARLVVCRSAAGECLGSTASFGDSRFQIEGLVPVLLAAGVQPFDVIRTRYDGLRFWFDELDVRHDPAAAAYLRSSLAQQLVPDELERPGLSAEERAAYELNYWQQIRPAGDAPAEAEPPANPRHRRKSKRPASESARPGDNVVQRLRENLSHAGARLIEFLERADSFRVTYSIGGHRYTSAVNKADLTVQVAGICLSGEDRKFDLASLVGVLHEAEGEGRIVPVGGHGMDEEHYWRVHPPRNE